MCLPSELSLTLPPSPRWGACFSLTCFVVWQSGGGVFISGGTVTLNSCDIHNNQATVRACLHGTTPLPRWGARFSLTCLHCLAERRWRLYHWLLRHSHVPVLRDLLEHCFCTFFKMPPKRHRTHNHAPPHRPVGVLAFTDVLRCLAVRRWRLHQGRHRDLPVVPDLLKYSF